MKEAIMKFVDCFVNCDCMRIIGNIFGAILLFLALVLFVCWLSSDLPIVKAINGAAIVAAIGFSFVCFILSNRK
jgi:F0F1-type ATP synthase membrane subunit a